MASRTSLSINQDILWFFISVSSGLLRFRNIFGVGFSTMCTIVRIGLYWHHVGVDTKKSTTMTYPGAQFISLVSEFIDELEIIQTEYWWWFQSRRSDEGHLSDDLISNHVIIDYTDFDHLMFKFTNDSDLPDFIRTKCLMAYAKVFGCQ